MIHTYKGLRDQVLRLLDESASESPTTLQLVKDLMNQAHQQRCTEYPWPFMLWPTAQTFTTVTGTHQYSLHQEFHRPLYFKNNTTKEYLIEVPFRSIAASGFDWSNDTGSMTHFCYWGTSPVQNQPTTAGVVQVVSDNALDTGTDYDIVVKGEDTSGQLRAEKLTPTGLTTVSGTITFRQILGVTKGSGWSGNMTLTIGSTTLMTLLGCEMGRQYKTIYSMENCVTGDVIEYRFYRQPLFLVNDYDVPELPAPHGQILVWDTLISLGGYLTDINSQTMAIWKMKQQEAQISLYQAYANEQQTLEAMPTYVRYMGDGEMEGRPWVIR